MTSFESAKQRFHNDPVFRQIVEQMLHGIETMNYTPTELRDAAVLASIIFAERHPQPFIISRKEAERLNIAFPDK